MAGPAGYIYCLSFHGAVNLTGFQMIRRELGIWKRLSHPNIVPFLGTVSGFGRFGNASLVSSWMPNGTLQDFLLKYDDKLTVAHRLQFVSPCVFHYFNFGLSFRISLDAWYCQWTTVLYVFNSSYEASVTRIRTVHSLSIVHGDLTCVSLANVPLSFLPHCMADQRASR